MQRAAVAVCQMNASVIIRAHGHIKVTTGCILAEEVPFSIPIAAGGEIHPITAGLQSHLQPHALMNESGQHLLPVPFHQYIGMVLTALGVKDDSASLLIGCTGENPRINQVNLGIVRQGGRISHQTVHGCIHGCHVLAEEVHQCIGRRHASLGYSRQVNGHVHGGGLLAVIGVGQEGLCQCLAKHPIHIIPGKLRHAQHALHIGAGCFLCIGQHGLPVADGYGQVQLNGLVPRFCLGNLHQH